MSQPGLGVDTATQHSTQNTSRQPCPSAPTLLSLQCTESKPKSGMVHKPVWDLALSYSRPHLHPLPPPSHCTSHSILLAAFQTWQDSLTVGPGFRVFFQSVSISPPHMANSRTFFKTLFTCHLPQEVSPDHHTLIASRTLPPQPLGNPDPS